jgi:hypothetical protein
MDPVILHFCATPSGQRETCSAKCRCLGFAWGIKFSVGRLAGAPSNSSSVIAVATIPSKTFGQGRVYITTQNHGYAVDEKTLEGTGAIVTHINLNDFTVEGLAHPELNILSVQYHPEAVAGTLGQRLHF